MNKVIILAYNEAKFIGRTIESIYDYFDEIIVVNDKSKDNTFQIVTDLKKKFPKIQILSNKKNIGPGKSLELGLSLALETSCKYIVKIDGDNQFLPDDIINLVELAEKHNVDFIKCDRFWAKGITGKIPKIRYLGNSIASILIKFTTSNKNINDPLNGLFLFSSRVASKIYLPKIFYRYGYPFYINAFVSKLSLLEDYKLKQYRNVVNYADEKSNLNPFIIFSKLIIFSIINFFGSIKTKLKNSQHQTSGVLDIISIITITLAFYSIKMIISIRYFEYQGNQGSWTILCLAFLILTFKVISNSESNMSEKFKKQFNYIN